jgi:adenine-specific DNA-methyltransferase
MRFIGNKEKLVGWIYGELQARNISGTTFFDVFSGTANVGKFFKSNGYQVFSSDLLYFSYVLQKAYIENNVEPKFIGLAKYISDKQRGVLFDTETPLGLVINHLNQITGIKGFIYKNYSRQATLHLEKPRMYLSEDNAKKIDAIRVKIEDWKHNKVINEAEYYVLLACLLESVPYYANISGVYAAFQKKWDRRALKDFRLREIKLINNKQENMAFNCDSVKLIDQIKTDVIYLDPPYNHRQYAPNYHLLETIAKYDNPEIKGVAGLRDYSQQKSKFCNKTRALEELCKISTSENYKYLVLSYNSEGIMPSEDIVSILSEVGNVELVEFDYLRFKSNNSGLSKSKKYIKEQIYILKRK